MFSFTGLTPSQVRCSPGLHPFITAVGSANAFCHRDHCLSVIWEVTACIQMRSLAMILTQQLLVDGCSAVSSLSLSAASSDGMAVELNLSLTALTTRQPTPGNCTLCMFSVWHQATCAHVLCVPSCCWLPPINSVFCVYISVPISPCWLHVEYCSHQKLSSIVAPSVGVDQVACLCVGRKYDKQASCLHDKGWQNFIGRSQQGQV